ncbi:hypothetical protein B0H10DRAFT_311994 [Mycena sp. CBHHK59/15]|nr:hypothetical protein B0H10DRAFT_311994 [Mycena sp. CBHHK59/15]
MPESQTFPRPSDSSQTTAPATLQSPGESAFPEDKAREKLTALEDGWEDDPVNPRNWSFRKKWTAVAIVYAGRQATIETVHFQINPSFSRSRVHHCITIVLVNDGSGLPEISEKYGIESVSILAMTLSIFLLTFAVG